MSAALVNIAEQAKELSADERAQLADIMLESLRTAPVSEIESAWEIEIQKRVSAFRQGRAKLFDAETVFAEARHLAA